MCLLAQEVYSECSSLTTPSTRAHFAFNPVDLSASADPALCRTKFGHSCRTNPLTR